MALKNRKKNYPLYETTHFRDFREMVENVADRYPDRVAFRYKLDPHQKAASAITFAECRDTVRALATELHSMDLAGKRIALIGGASVDWFLSYTAIMTVGAVTVPIDKELPVADIASIIRNAGKTAILITHDLSEAISLADRVIVLTHRPAQVKAVFPIRLTLADNSLLAARKAPEYTSYFNSIWEEIADEKA